MALQDLLKKTASYIAGKAKEALAWYKQSVETINTKPSTGGTGGNIPPTSDFFKKSSYPEIGKMYLYTYNPVLREKLPFFDMYPLVIVIDYFSGKHGAGFIGLNLHYLPPGARITLLTALENIRNNDKMDDTTKFNISYRLLKGAADRYYGYQNCIKKYYVGHVVSSFHEIYPQDWEKVVLLPLQRWVVNPNNKTPAKLPY